MNISFTASKALWSGFVEVMMRRISGTRELLYLEQMEARFLLCVAAPPGTAAAGELHVISNMHDPADVAAQLRKAADKIEHEAVRIREVTPL